MAYIYLYSATRGADLREFTSPLVLHTAGSDLHTAGSIRHVTMLLSGGKLPQPLFDALKDEGICAV